MTTKRRELGKVSRRSGKWEWYVRGKGWDGPCETKNDALNRLIEETK